MIKSGLFYLGEESIKLNLIDILGNKETAIKIAKELANIKDGKVIEYKEKKSVLDIINKFAKTTGYYIGLGIGSEIKLNKETKIII